MLLKAPRHAVIAYQRFRNVREEHYSFKNEMLLVSILSNPSTKLTTFVEYFLSQSTKHQYATIDSLGSKMDRA